MLTSGQYCFLTHCSSIGFNEQDLTDLFSLLYMHWNDSRVDDGLVACLSKITEENVKIPTMGIRILEIILKSMHTRIIGTKDSEQSQLGMTLDIALISTRNGLGYPAKLRDALIDNFIKQHNVPEDHLDKLLRLEGRSWSKIVHDISNKSMWSASGRSLLVQIISRSHQDEQNHLYESVLVGNASHLEPLMSVIQAVGWNIDAALCFHDHLVQHKYPCAASKRLRDELSTILETHIESGLYRWAVTNICSNMERTLSTITIDDPRINEMIYSCICLLSVLVVFDVAEITNLLDRLSQLIDNNDNVGETMDGIVSWTCFLLDTEGNKHLSSSSKLFSALLGRQQTTESVLNNILQRRFQERFMNNDLISILDLDVQGDVKFINSKLSFFTLYFDKLLTSRGNYLSKKFTDAIHLRVSLHFKAILSEKSPSPDTVLVYNNSIHLFSAVCLYYLQRGWKTWRQLLSGYSITSQWIILGGTEWHFKLPPLLYLSWIKFAKKGIADAEQFITEYRGLIFSSQIALSVMTMSDLGWRSYRDMLGLNQCTSLSSLLESEPKDEAVWKSIPRLMLQRLKSADDTNEFFTQWSPEVFTILESFINHDLFNDCLVQFVKIGQFLDHPRCKLFLEIVPRLYRIIKLRGTQHAIDQFDVFLDFCCEESEEELEGTVMLAVEVVEFILMRLTSIVFAKHNLVTSTFTIALLRTILFSLPRKILRKYLELLYSMISEMKGNQLLTKFYHYIVQFICKSPEGLRDLPPEFFEISQCIIIHNPPSTILPHNDDYQITLHLLPPPESRTGIQFEALLYKSIYESWGSAGRQIALDWYDNLRESYPLESHQHLDLEVAESGFTEICIEYHPFISKR